VVTRSNRLQFPAAEAVRAGFSGDPFVENITRLVKCKLLSDLKWKAKIEVAEGAFLMGTGFGCLLFENGY
jgi:hypothetical protein